MEYIDEIRDGGGTNIAYALERALAAQDADDPERPRVVVFITDGRSEPQAALEVAQRSAGDVRVFTVGIGDGVERPLLSRIAALRRGRFTFIESADAIEARVSTLYRQIEAPVLVGLAIEAEGAQLQRSYPRSLPDLFRDDELRVVARVRGTGRMHVRIRGTFRGEQVTHEARFVVPEESRRPWVGRVWAEQRVDDLLEEIALHGPEQELVDEVTELALAYRFVTPYTAFLAIPASELTAEGAAEMESARQRSARIMAANPDAAALMAGGRAGGGSSAEQIAPTAGSGGDDDAEMEPGGAADYGPSLAMESSGAGCASCATAGTRSAPPAAALGLLLALAAILMRRRR
jgi:Ca-activated chloride channel family protein